MLNTLCCSLGGNVDIMQFIFVPNNQSWALSVFFNFFNNKK